MRQWPAIGENAGLKWLSLMKLRIGERAGVGIVPDLAHLRAIVDRDPTDLDHESQRAEHPRHAPHGPRSAIQRPGHGQECERQERNEVARTERAVACPVLERGVEHERHQPGPGDSERGSARGRLGVAHAIPPRHGERDRGREPHHAFTRGDQQTVEPDQERVVYAASVAWAP